MPPAATAEAMTTRIKGRFRARGRAAALLHDDDNKNNNINNSKEKSIVLGNKTKNGTNHDNGSRVGGIYQVNLLIGRAECTRE